MQHVLLASALSIVIAASPGAAHAQDVHLEHRALASNSNHATTLYITGLSLVVVAGLVGLYGATRFIVGDTITFDGTLGVIAAPIIGTAAVTIVMIAIGLDIGSGERGTAVHHGSTTGRAGRDAKQASLGHATQTVYIVGASALALGGLPIAVMSGIDISAWLSRPAVTGGGVDPALYVPFAVIAGLGYLALMIAAGMDVAAGAWSGAMRAPRVDVGPIPGGAMLTVSGALS